MTTSRCRDLDKNLAYTAFKEGLTPGPFVYKLNAHPPTNYKVLLEMSLLHAQAKFTTYGDLSPNHRQLKQEVSTVNTMYLAATQKL